MKTASEAVDVLLIVNARSAPEENIESNEMKIYAIAVIEMMTARTHDTTSRAPMFAEDAPKSDATVVRCNVNCARQSFSARARSHVGQSAAVVLMTVSLLFMSRKNLGHPSCTGVMKVLSHESRMRS